jgi:hypothetical protein
MDLSHSRPHLTFARAPVKPFNRFILAVAAVVTNCPQSQSRTEGPPTDIRLGDARKLVIKDKSIDLVLTSPPYLNAIDYMRCSKFSLVWMGYSVRELRKIRGESVGAEVASEKALNTDWVIDIIKQLNLVPALSRKHYALLARYVLDMGDSLAEVSRVLSDAGRAVYVVGDSTVRGTFISNSSIVQSVAEAQGLRLTSRQSRQLPANRRYLPPPRQSQINVLLDSRMRSEVVAEFRKM